YAEHCHFQGAHLRAVATSAVRDARNRDEIIARAHREAGLSLEVISGREEARLVCLGVLEGTAPEVQSLCIDIGGGSTEVALARGEHPISLFSLDVGAFRLFDRVDPTGRYDGRALDELRALAADEARALPADLGLTDGIVCSGTTRALVGFATA